MTWRQIDEVCTAEDRALSLDYSKCVEKCSDNEFVSYGCCACKIDSALDEEKNSCVPRSQCNRI